MRLLVTEAEFAEILVGLFRDETGMLLLDIPDACIERDSPRLVLVAPNVVRFGDRHTKLTSTEYALVRFALAHGGSVDFDDARDAVWMKAISDKRIANVCSEISGKFADAGIPVDVSGEGAVVSVREI